MAQITLDLDDRIAERLADAAKREHVSESAWVGRLIAARLGADDRETRLQWFREARGSWPEGDDRPIEEIMRELRPRDLPERSFDFG